MAEHIAQTLDVKSGIISDSEVRANCTEIPSAAPQASLQQRNMIFDFCACQHFSCPAGFEAGILAQQRSASEAAFVQRAGAERIQICPQSNDLGYRYFEI